MMHGKAVSKGSLRALTNKASDPEPILFLCPPVHDECDQDCLGRLGLFGGKSSPKLIASWRRPDFMPLS